MSFRRDLVTIDDPALGAITTAAPFVAGHGTIRHLGRDLGADNARVYGDWLGLTASELAALRTTGVV